VDGLAPAGAGAACAVPVATPADTAMVTAATAAMVMARFTAVLPSREPARPFGRVTGVRKGDVRIKENKNE